MAQKNSLYKPFSAIILIVAVCFIMSISMVSAFEFDNIKNTKERTWDGKDIIGNKLLEKYKPIEIKNWLGLGETLFEGYLSQHTETCGTDCSSTIEIKINKDGTLIDDIKFLTLQKDNSWLEENVRNYNFEYWGDVNDYENQCEFSGYSSNGTKLQECSQVVIGFHKGWVNYNIGDEVEKGTYTLKLDAKKKPSRTVDWVIKTNGKWLESWATWGNISGGDDAEVILNAPGDLSIDYDRSVTFNASANITGGSTVSNMTLWNNISGTWQANGTEEIGETEYNTAPAGFGGGIATTPKTGMRATMKKEAAYIIITKNSGCTATTAYILDASKSQLANGTFSGNNATINYVLNNNTQYYFVVDSEGSSYNRVESADLVGNFPYERNSLNYTGGLYETTDSTFTYNIDNITTVESSTNPTKTWLRTIDASTLWNVRACDSDGDCGFAPNNFTVLLDLAAPTFVVESPAGVKGYGTIGSNETLNITFTDTNLDSCWYNYNGTNITITNCLTGVKNSTNFLLEYGNTNMTIYANDSLGNLNSTFISWSYNLTENSQNYPSSSVESSSEIYIANLSYNSSKFSVITGVLTLNGTEYSGIKTGTGDNAIFTTSATMPSITETTIFTGYWTISLTDVSGTINYNLTSSNVTVSIINLSLCDALNNVSFWNFTILNESNSVEINSTFEGTFIVSPNGSTSTNSFSYSNTNGNLSQYDFCISPGTEAYDIDASIKLTKSGYVDKFYNYESIIVTNSTREDNLYMLATGDSTSFIIHTVYNDGRDVTEAEVKVQRYYPGTGLWAVTEILTTNYEGEAIGHILSEDADYRFNVSLDGVSIYNSSATKIVCETAPCTVTLNIPISSVGQLDILSNLVSSLTYSPTTNIFTYTYSDSSGLFTSSRLNVIRVNPSNATVVTPCNETKTTASGVITCDISGLVNGTYQATGYIKRGTTESVDKRIFGILGTRIYNSMGNDGVLWSIFIFMAIIMLGISRPTLAIVFGVSGIIFLKVLEVINIGLLSVFSLITIAIILLVRMGRE